MKALLKKSVLPLMMVLGGVQGVHAEAESEKSLVDQFAVHGVLTLSNDYRSRGFSKSGHNPSVQGGLVLTHSSGAYLMLWGGKCKYT